MTAKNQTERKSEHYSNYSNIGKLIKVNNKVYFAKHNSSVTNKIESLLTITSLPNTLSPSCQL